jgi:DNA segregation ATPase FtsK/SpoIIIE, S-DNA-T family
MPRRYSRNKKNKKPSIWKNVVLWVFLLFIALWMLWVQWGIGSKGLLGEMLGNGLFALVGHSSYLFPFLVIYGLLAILYNPRKQTYGPLTLLTGGILILVACSMEIDILRSIINNDFISGGIVGAKATVFTKQVLGTIGTSLFGIALLIIGAHFLFEISWRRTFFSFLKLLKEDYDTWVDAREEVASKLKSSPKAELEIKRPTPKTIIEQPKPQPEPVKPEIKEVVTPKNDIPDQEGEKPSADKPFDAKTYRLPSTDLLAAPKAGEYTGPTNAEIEESSKKLEETLSHFNIEAQVVGVSPGPVVTRYEIKPKPGVKVSSIVSLSNDIALAMKARGIRIEAPIPGKDAIGFEIPNEKPAMVLLREIVEDPVFANRKNRLLVALGRHADGTPAVADLEKMPHVLVAGATNSGKSVCLHSLIISILYKNSPDMVKFLLIDPKRLELAFYENIPHLYDPNLPSDMVSVITQPKEAVRSLKALVKVMEYRYTIFEKARVKNIESYNKWAEKNNEPPAFYIVVIIDELADLMMQTKVAIEDSIQRLAQMARAVGIHLVLATQRPSVDVVTGVIKANLPSRIAFQVASKMDSRVILDSPGGESLLGKGDMLYLGIDAQKPCRIQGAYTSEEEITKLADYLRSQGKPYYPEQIPQDKPDDMAKGLGASSEELKQALRLIIERRRVSQDLLKAHFGSSARATNLLSILEMKGFISKPEGSNRWEIQFDKIEHQLSVLESQSALNGAVPNN